ncbi:MAG: transcriptional regulator [Acidobacteria bacterium]|nr:MAG: transcriptional regulator [Acidobacteriota bacterium]
MDEGTCISTTPEIRVLLVDDHERDLRNLSRLLSSWNYSVETAFDGEEACQKLADYPADIMLTDLVMPRIDGFELLRRLHAQDEGPIPIVVTAFTDMAADTTRDLGAFCYLPKPVEPKDLRELLERASAQRRSGRDGGIVLEMGDRGAVADMVGTTPEMQKIFALLNKVAPSCASVLITGESGTGKELVARAIHSLSPRRAGPFVAINCAGFPEGLVESELFGHEKGAFTGAVERRPGCLELANGGTLLLDEIGELPIQTQAKLLRVLEDSRVRRIGGKSEIQLDVRILAATNRNTEQIVRSGHFRQDLYYRLNVFHIQLPPLRERKGDLPVLCEALLASLNRKHERHVTEIHPDVLECFAQYGWPGNVRELRNVLESAVILVGEGMLTTEHLPVKFARGPCVRESSGFQEPSKPAHAKDGVVALPFGTTVEEAEKALIQFTLQHTHNNKSRAAKILGISPKTLHCKIKQYRMQSETVGA